MSPREKWDARFASGDHVGLAPLPFLVDLVKRVPPGRALDIAAGAGRHSRLLADAGWDVTAVDCSGVGLAHIGARVRTIRADLEAGEYKIEHGAWDLIVDCCYLQRDLIPAIQAGVREGGRIAMAIPRPGAMNPAFTADPDELRAWFSGWIIEDWREDKLTNLVAVRSRTIEV